MAASQKYGTHSSDSDTCTLTDRLAQICRSEELTKLHTVLGKDAQLHLVGGTVRDVALGETPLDFDLTVVYRPEDVSKKLEAKGIHVVPTGIEHGTVTAVFGSSHIEITSFRVPSPRDPGEAGQHYSDTIEQDLAGRDFTINAIAYSLDNKQLIDPFSGLDDLKQGVLRAVENPDLRFSEDPLRIMRMVRFGRAAGRIVDPETFAAAKLRAAELQRISIERIRDELIKILCAPCAAAGFRELHILGLLKHALPELLPAVGFEQNQFHHLDVFEHTLAVIENCPAEIVLRLTALFHDLGKPHTLTIGDDGMRHFYRHEIVSDELTMQAMQRLRFSKDLTRRVRRLVRYHMRPLECGASAVRRLLRDLEDDFDTWVTFKRADALGCKMSVEEIDQQLNIFNQMVEAERERVLRAQREKLAVTGHDLVALGMQPGPPMGEILSRMREMVLDDPDCNTKDHLLACAKQWIGHSSD